MQPRPLPIFLRITAAIDLFIDAEDGIEKLTLAVRQRKKRRGVQWPAMAVDFSAFNGDITAKQAQDFTNKPHPYRPTMGPRAAALLLLKGVVPETRAGTWAV